MTTRRSFIKATAIAGGGLLVGCRVGGSTEGGSRAELLAPNAWVRITPDGKVTVVVSQVEMGQGTYTSMPMLVAEELEVGLDQVTVEAAPPDNARYYNRALGWQATGGSLSVRTLFVPLRKAGAATRMMLIAAAAEQWGVDAASCRASRGEVLHDATGRKAGYGSLVARAATLRAPQDPPLKKPEEFTLIGTRAKRVDGPSKVNGSALFSLDVRVPGMKVATVAACPVFGGRLKSVDDTRAMQVKGVHQVVRIEDAVAVVADHMYAATQGLAALVIAWDDGPGATTTTADVVAALEKATEAGGPRAHDVGNVESALATAARKVEATYEVPFLAHATMEPPNCTLHVRADGADVWTCTQIAARARDTVADVTGLPKHKVILHNLLLGGGFGRRLEVDYITQAAKIARQVAGPVKIVWTREEDIQHDMYRPYYHDRIAAGMDQSGKPVAWHHRIAGSSILARWAEKTPRALRIAGLRGVASVIRGIDFDAVDGAVGIPYALPNFRVQYKRQEPFQVPTAFWRGVGPTHNTFVVESFMDELAHSAGKDPVEFRRELLGQSPRALAVLERAAAESGWGQPLPAGRARGVSLQFAFGSYVSQVAEISRENGAIRVHRVTCAVDCGQVINPDTVEAQMQGGIIFGITGALWGEITIKGGRVEQTNFGDYRMMRMNEAPAIDVHLIESREFPGGIGEPGTAAAAPAVANAVFALTGTRVRKLPIEKALAAAGA